MFTTIAFVEKAARAAAAYNEIAAINDAHITVSGDDIQLPSLSQIVLVCGGLSTTGDTAKAMRLTTPSMREKALFQIAPFNWITADGVAEPLDPTRLVDMRDNPMVLVPREKLNAQESGIKLVTNASWVVVMLADGPIVPVKGPMFTVRAVGVSAAVVDSWASSALTFDEDLPAGRYQIVGFRPVSPNIVAARLVFVGGGWRPGAIGCDHAADVHSDIFRYGKFGVFGEFEDLEPPTVEILALVADAAATQEYWFDLIQIRKGPGA